MWQLVLRGAVPALVRGCNLTGTGLRSPRKEATVNCAMVLKARSPVIVHTLRIRWMTLIDRSLARLGIHVKERRIGKGEDERPTTAA